MKRKFFTIGLSFLLVMSFMLAQAQVGNQNPGRHFNEKGHRGMMHEKLLTDEQKEVFKDIRLGSMKEAKPLQDELRELRAHHQTLMTAENPDMKEIYASIDKMSDVKTKLAKVKAKSRIEMASHLTEEQKLKMAELKKQHKGKMHNHAPRQKNKGWHD